MCYYSYPLSGHCLNWIVVHGNSIIRFCLMAYDYSICEFIFKHHGLHHHGQILPGFRMLFGSKVCFIPFMMPITLSDTSICRKGALVIPMPCSPEMLPPRRNVTSNSSWTAFFARLNSSSFLSSVITLIWRLPSPA